MLLKGRQTPKLLHASYSHKALRKVTRNRGIMEILFPLIGTRSSKLQTSQMIPTGRKSNRPSPPVLGRKKIIYIGTHKAVHNIADDEWNESWSTPIENLTHPYSCSREGSD